MTSSLQISAYTLGSCLGLGKAASWASIAQRRSGLSACHFEGLSLNTFVGEVPGLASVAVPTGLAAYNCRNNQLAELVLNTDGFRQAVQAAAQKYGRDRVGVYLGSSTSGLLSTELAYKERAANAQEALPKWLRYSETHNMFSLADFVKRSLGLTGPASVSSIACASSAKVFASAARAIASGVVDAAVVGGVDTLCLTTLYGFGSLELLSPEPCRPYDANRKGISIAEAGAFALLERPEPGMALPHLIGYGESSDAHHMSSPHPQGAGAQVAIRNALGRANITPDQVDYINLHGTATPSNDSAEDAAVFAVFGDRVPVSSTKAYHGHTLGAAGALEAAICLLAMQHNIAPGGMHVQVKDPLLSAHYLTEHCPKPLRIVASNSFGFGGANACLVFGAPALAGAA
jgi:3-oxoacyl-[acyl-carrier-protein] synthase I